MNVLSVAYSISGIGAILLGIDQLHRYRAPQMQALAGRWGFGYIKGRPWYRIGKDPRLPLSFRLRGYPVNSLSRTWNVLEGEKDGCKVVVLDGILGTGRGARYCTFVAAKTDENPFPALGKKEKLAHSNGWFAIYRLRFLQIPWTMSVERIEELIGTMDLHSAKK